MNETCLSNSSILKIIIPEELHTSKVSASWVSWLLTPFLKQTWCSLSREKLNLLEQDEEDFVSNLETMDETWIYQYNPETKEMSKEWNHCDSPPSRRIRCSSLQRRPCWIFWETVMQTTWRRIRPLLVSITVYRWIMCDDQKTAQYDHIFFLIMHLLTYLNMWLRNQSDVVLKFCYIHSIPLILPQAMLFNFQN